MTKPEATPRKKYIPPVNPVRVSWENKYMTIKGSTLRVTIKFKDPVVGMDWLKNVMGGV